MINQQCHILLAVWKVSGLDELWLVEALSRGMKKNAVEEEDFLRSSFQNVFKRDTAKQLLNTKQLIFKLLNIKTNQAIQPAIWNNHI